MATTSIGPFDPTTLPKLHSRFWSKVDTSGSCWIWKGGRFPNGYGSFTITSSGHKRAHGAHRIAWLLTRGEWPQNYVCHACDNPACVRPDHLFTGTAQANKRDSIAKGRAYNGGHTMTSKAAKGEAHGHARIPTTTVREIRKRYAAGQTPAEIAREFDEPYGTVYCIVTGKNRRFE